MLTHPTLDKLHVLHLTGMAKAFAEQMDMPDLEALSTEERLGLMVELARLCPGPKGLSR